MPPKLLVRQRQADKDAAPRSRHPRTEGNIAVGVAIIARQVIAVDLIEQVLKPGGHTHALGHLPCTEEVQHDMARRFRFAVGDGDIGPSQRRRITAHGGDHFNRRIRHTRRRIVSDALDIILDLTHKQRGPHIGARGGKIDARLRQPGRLRIKSEITDIDVAIGQPAAGIDRKPAIALDIAGHCLLARQRHTP